MKNWKKYCLTLNLSGSMKTIIQYGSHEIVLCSTHVGQAKPWDGKTIKEAFNINVIVNDRFITNFLFYQKDSWIRKKEDLVYAFYCFVSDASYAIMSIGEFASEFGYTDIELCIKTYQACQVSLEQYQSLKIQGDIYDLLNWLTETYNI